MKTDHELANEYIHNHELAKSFAKSVQELRRIAALSEKGIWIEDLLKWTTGTLYKAYDQEEEYDHIVRDTMDWIKGKAKYMD